MEKRKYEFSSCTTTAGRPFENGPKCPLFLKIHEYLKSNGWGQVYYNSFKTGTGDLCNTKYRRMENPGEKNPSVLSMMEVNIEGTNTTCTMTAALWTYHPKNILRTIDHECETGIMDGLEEFLKPYVLNDFDDNENQ